MARAHALIARQEWEQAVAVLEGVLPRDTEGEARELLGVVECEQGEVEKGREVSSKTFGRDARRRVDDAPGR